MSEQMNPIDQALKMAKQKEEEMKNAPPIEMVAIQTPGSAVATYSAHKAPSLAGLSQGTMNVEGYLKVKEFGLVIDDKPNLVDSIDVEIDTTEGVGLMPFECIRFTVAGNVSYIKTYDGINANTGGTWQSALEKAQRVDMSARPYQGVDISMKLIADAKDAKGNIICQAGTVLGHSTSITNKGNMADLVKQLTSLGLLGTVVKVRITSEARKNKNGQTWGILAFTIIE